VSRTSTDDVVELIVTQGAGVTDGLVLLKVCDRRVSTVNVVLLGTGGLDDILMLMTEGIRTLVGTVL
jgi:hypothetical protein